MPLYVDTSTWCTVEHRKSRSFAPESLSGVLPLLDSCLKIVRGQGCIDGIGWVRRGIKSDHKNTFVPGLLNDSKHSGRIVGRNQDTLYTGANQVLYCSHLTFIIAIELTKSSDQLCPLLLGF